jgi:hemoglobin
MSEIKKDIQDKEDIVLLVNTFYNKVNNNDIIGPIFNEVMKVDWNHHLPKMYAFWGGIILNESGYAGNPIQVHLEISKQTVMSNSQFDEWIKLFEATIHELFEGERAEETIKRAKNIALVMLHKINMNPS